MPEYLKFLREKHEEMFPSICNLQPLDFRSTWFDPPTAQSYGCQCGQAFNGVGGGTTTVTGVGDFCPKCGAYHNISQGHTGPPPLFGATWSEAALRMGLDKCYRRRSWLERVWLRIKVWPRKVRLNFGVKTPL